MVIIELRLALTLVVEHLEHKVSKLVNAGRDCSNFFLSVMNISF